MESPTECHNSNKFDFALEINTTGDQFIVEPSETLLVARKKTGWNKGGEIAGAYDARAKIKIRHKILECRFDGIDHGSMSIFITAPYQQPKTTSS